VYKIKKTIIICTGKEESHPIAENGINSFTKRRAAKFPYITTIGIKIADY